MSKCSHAMSITNAAPSDTPLGVLRDMYSYMEADCCWCTTSREWLAVVSAQGDEAWACQVEVVGCACLETALQKAASHCLLELTSAPPCG